MRKRGHGGKNLSVFSCRTLCQKNSSSVEMPCRAQEREHGCRESFTNELSNTVRQYGSRNFPLLCYRAPEKGIAVENLSPVVFCSKREG